MKLFNKLFGNKSSQKHESLSESAQRWNRFIDEICFKDTAELSLCQKAAVLSFWYDAEMNSGGHSGYFDCYPEVSPDELIWALSKVGGTDYIDNFKEAVLSGSEDDYVKTDNRFGSIVPSLTDLLQQYIEAHTGEVFANVELKDKN